MECKRGLNPNGVKQPFQRFLKLILMSLREKKRGETYSNSFTTKSAFSSIKAGDYGGNVTISLLEVDVTAEHHGSMFVCEAKNEALGQSVHNAMTISVNCEWLVRSRMIGSSRAVKFSYVLTEIS